MEGSSKSASSSAESSSTTTGTAPAGSSSFVTELFGKPPSETKPRSVFDELFSTAPPTGVRRDYYGSGGQAWKNEQSWSQLMTSPDGSSYTDREIAQLSDKSSSFPAYTHKMTEHTLSSSIHYGGRDDYVVTSDSHNQYTQKPTTYDGNSEDGSGGASPRGNIWLGSVYY